MTAAQQKKLNTILAKLERLENDVARSGGSWKEQGAFKTAKDRLMELLD
jgi:hypothetical protein